jgi:hypothetical protein
MRYNYKLLVPIGLFIILITSSCELYNPTEPIPSYIHIQKIGLTIIDTTTTPGTGQGSKSSKISDAWVYIDDQLIGCFELPVTFPVLYEGKHKVKIRAGIKVDGIATNRSPYPFYNSVDQDVDLQKGIITTLSPTVTYTSTAKFTFLTDFESIGVTIDTTPGRSDSTFQILYSATPDPNIFEGTHSAIAFVDAIRTRFECETVTPFILPKGGAPVFLEFNYKCNYEFTVSIYAYGTATSSQFAVLHFNPSENWNKTYVYLTPVVSGASTALNYKIAWGMINNTGVPSAYLSLDNIKVINN